jgi:hypothetical protein
MLKSKSKAGRVVQGIECLPCKHKALRSNASQKKEKVKANFPNNMCYRIVRVCKHENNVIHFCEYILYCICMNDNTKLRTEKGKKTAIATASFIFVDE